MTFEEQDETVEETPDADAPSGATAANTPDEAPVSGAAGSAPTGGGSQAAIEPLAPKERRARARAAKAAKAPRRAAMSPEERQAERDERRSKKAAGRRTERQRTREKASADRKPVADVAAREHVPGVQKVRQGIVVSDRADKTITVRIDTARRHRRYQKIVRTSRTLHAHDERNDAHVGDTVVVREARPLSRTKRWRLVEVVERAK
jgi:small subunit ribosomal protein S17